MKNQSKSVRVFGTLLAASFCILSSGCRTPSFNSAITPEQEKTIGDWAAAQIQSESNVPTDTGVGTEVADITKRLDAVTTFMTPPRILISDTDAYTVASLPGGWVVISARTVNLFHDQPDVIAGLLAHEFAHVENDDALKQMTGALGSDTLVNLTTQGKYTDTSNVAVQLMNFGHSMDDEYRADAEGVRIAAAAGYDPHGIITAITTLSAVTPTTDAQWLIVHPVTPKRLKLLDYDVTSLPKLQKS